ncbi:MAG: hypothetical protein LBM01_03270 [Christensenellaceae bacterium]|jgi:hypothetical protein|nr:hypothetical protein [Christensenellaceae bacterium]
MLKSNMGLEDDIREAHARVIAIERYIRTNTASGGVDREDEKDLEEAEEKLAKLKAQLAAQEAANEPEPSRF